VSRVNEAIVSYRFTTCSQPGTWALLRPVAVALVAVALSFSATARDAIDRSPYGPVVADMLERLYASEVPCELTLAPDTRCIIVRPGTVAIVAEALEAVLEEYAGTLLRSEWRSANGVYHVEVRLADELWGVLELWLTEPTGQVVSGRLQYVAKSRNGDP